VILCAPKMAHKETFVPVDEAISSRQKNVVVQNVMAPFRH